MNNVLGQYGLGGRLGDSIRERQGMAYYALSSFDGNVGDGPLVVRAGVAPANVERTIASIDDEIGRMRQDGVTPGELADAKRYLIGSLPRQLETNGGIADSCTRPSSTVSGWTWTAGCRASSTASRSTRSRPPPGWCSTRRTRPSWWLATGVGRVSEDVILVPSNPDLQLRTPDGPGPGESTVWRSERSVAHRPAPQRSS